MVALVEAVERGLDDAGISSGLDLLLQLVALRPTSDVHQRGKPIESGEQLSVDCARLDDARPADDQRCAVAALPRAALLTLERGDATIRECGGLGSIVSGEDNDGVAGLAHVVELFEDEADIVVHLLHASFVGAPVLATALAEHGLILR